MTKVILIPSYEPDDKLIKLVDELKKNKLNVVVVNDGSSKEYDSIFNKIKKKVKVISYETNQGKGYALKIGLEYIKENYKDYVVVTMDSDGQHSVKDAIKLSNYAEKHPNELVIGKRIRSEKTPLRSKLGNSITMFIYRLSTGVKVYDTQTGLRAFTSELMDFMQNVEGNRYEYEMNVLLYAPSNDIKIKEIEIETIYIENNEGSHFNTIKDSYRVYKEIIKYSLSSIISFIIDYSLFAFFSIFLSITLSNIFARIISASINFTINKKIVFKSDKGILISLIEYALLAIFILVCNTLLLNLLVYIGINKFIAKLIVEISLFIISFLVQKTFVFKKKK